MATVAVTIGKAATGIILWRGEMVQSAVATSVHGWVSAHAWGFHTES